MGPAKHEKIASCFLVFVFFPPRRRFCTTQPAMPATKARHSTCDPDGVDIYCGTSPRPRPSPADHTWRMSIGGGGDGGGSGVAARVPGAVRVLQQQWHFDGGGHVDESDEAVADAIGTHPPVSDADGTDPPVAKPAPGEPVDGGGRSGNNGTRGEIDAAPGHRQQGGRCARCCRATPGVQMDAIACCGSESFT